MSLLSTIGSGILRLGAKVARSAAQKGATKTKEAVKKGVQNKRIADSRKVPKSQRTKKQQAARDKRAADIKAKRQAARAKKQAKVKNATAGVKGRIAKTLGGLGALGSSLLGGGRDRNDPAPKDGAGQPQPVPQQTTTKNEENKQIDLSWVPQAMAVAIPSIKDPEEERAYSLSNLVVTKDVELDEEAGIPFIESGTLIPSRIAEIGTLFAITDALRNQITDLNKQMFIANSTLKEIKKKLGVAIAQNAATNRANERRRDEEEVEGGRIKKAAMFVGGAAAAYVTVKTLGFLTRVGNAAMLGAVAMFADDVASMVTDDESEPEIEEDTGALDPDKDYADSLETAQEGEYLTPDQMRELGLDPPEEEAEPQSELADTLEGAADAMSGGAAGTLLDAGMIAGGGAMVAGALGATATAAVLAPVAAAATALGAGMAVGTIIADNTQIDESIGQAYEDFNEENLDEMTSREEMSQKYGEAQGTVGFFGDLLGEGLFDTEEDPKDIYAAFRDMTWDDHAELNKAYQEEYGQSLASATWKAVGDAGSEAINNLISQNTMEKHLAKTKKEGDGVENKMWWQQPVEEGEPLTIDRENFIMDFEAARGMEEGAEADLAAFKAKHGEPDTEIIRNFGMGDFLFPGYSDPKLQEEFLKLNTQLTDAEFEREEMFVAEKARLLGVDAKELMHDPLDFSLEMMDWLNENNIPMPESTTYGEIVRRFNYAVMKRLDQESRAYFGRDALTPETKALELPEVGDVIPINDILEEVPEVLQKYVDVPGFIEEQVEKPINTIIGELNGKVEEVVDTTIDEKIQTAIVPIIQDVSQKVQQTIPAGTTMKSQLESANPHYISRDPFITIKIQT